MKITWRGKTHDKVRYGEIDGTVVVEIFADHKHRHIVPNYDVYSVKVLGKSLQTRYRNIDDAKHAAQQAYNESKL